MSTSSSTVASSSPLRIGILGAAQIARKNVAAIQDSSNCVVTAIASRTHSKVMKFVEEHIPNKKDLKIFSGDDAYSKLIDSSDLVDALYIPLPTSLHKDWVIKTLRSGKHVLLEKPVALDVSEAEEMFKVANEMKKYIMDGTMFVHHPRTMHLLETLRNQESFGEVVRINSQFTFLGDSNFFKNDIRIKKRDDGGDPLGCIGDLGWYCVRMAILCMGTSTDNNEASRIIPTKAQVTSFRLNENGVPIDATCLVHFSSTSESDDNDSIYRNQCCQRILSFHCSFIHGLRQRVEIYGTKEKSATITDFVLPHEKQPHSYEIYSQSLINCDKITIPSSDVVLVESPFVQEVMMWNNFGVRCRAMDNNEEKNPLNDVIQESCRICLQTQSVMNALMESIELGKKEIHLGDPTNKGTW